MIDFDKYVISKIDMLTATKITTGELRFILDEIKDGSLENSSETVYGTGAGDRKISAIDKTKETKFSCTNGFVIGGLLSAQTGSEIQVASTATLLTPKTELLKVTQTKNGATITTTAVTSFKAEGVIGNEIPYIYKANKDKTAGKGISKEYKQAAAVGEGTFTYSPDTKTITVHSDDFKDGDIIAVIYKHNTAGKKIVNRTNTFTEECEVVLDIIIHDPCDNSSQRHAQIVIPRAKIDGNFSFEFGSEPSVHAFSCEALTSLCSIEDELWYMIIPD